LTFSAGGVFNLDVNASGIRADLDLYVEKHGSTDVTITDLPPDVSITSPENTTYSNSVVPLIFTVTKPIHWSGYSLDGGANVTISSNISLVGLVDGPHSLTVYANDSAGHMGASEAVYFTVIDTISPIITLITPLNETYSTITIPLTYHTNEVLAWTAYSLDHGANVPITGNTTLTGLGEGSHSIRIYGTDIAANTGESAETYFSFEIRHDVSIIEVYTSKAGCQPVETAAEGSNCTVFAVVHNPGSFTEIVNVTIYANDTAFDLVETSLDSGETTTLTFIWATSVFNKGNYTLKADACPVPEETETVDNTAYSPRQLLLTIAGDVDGDRDVDIFDIVRMANCYGASPPSLRYDPNCDLDDDGDIDIFDIVVAASNYSKSW
ncbi:MAG: hypothetical protein JSV35_01010, partial [Candidatus Bathyarchaeota archaeon]